MLIINPETITITPSHKMRIKGNLYAFSVTYSKIESVSFIPNSILLPVTLFNFNTRLSEVTVSGTAKKLPFAMASLGIDV